MRNDIYSIAYTVHKNKHIRNSRKEKVIDILNQSGIQSLFDLKNSMIPQKGLTNNEIRQLCFIKKDMHTVDGMQKRQADKLYAAIGCYASKHEQSRIFNILLRNKISSERILASTPDEQLANIPGIGEKSMNVLNQVTRDFVNQSITTTFIGKPTAPELFEQQLFQPLVY